MFQLFGRRPTVSPGSRLTLAIDGMHCPSCGVNIDGTLEELPGVIESITNYAKSTTQVTLDSTLNPNLVIKEIAKLGYHASIVPPKPQV